MSSINRKTIHVCTQKANIALWKMREHRIITKMAVTVPHKTASVCEGERDGEKCL